MAKVTYSALIGSVRGSVGGVTFRGGAVGGVVSARYGGKASQSLAQQRHQSVVAEARRDFETLGDLDRAAFEFSVSEGYQFRPEHGARFSSPRAGYVAWYSVGRYCGGTLDYFKEVAVMRRYGAAREVYATAATTPAASFRFYFPTNWVFAPFAVWMARAKTVKRLPARPVWRLVYAAGFDERIAPVLSGLGPPRNYYAEFGPWVQDRVSYWQPGQVVAYRYYGPTGSGGYGAGATALVQL